MNDRFADTAASLHGPATHAFAIVPDDDADLEEATRAIYCGTGGDLKLTTVSGATVTFTQLPDGAVLPVRALKIWATQTSASSLVGLS